MNFKTFKIPGWAIGGIVLIILSLIGYRILNKPEPPPASEKIYIPAGEFQMGSDFYLVEGRYATGYPYLNTTDLPLHEVYLDGYYIDATEVTNAQYAQCVFDRACTLPYNGGILSLKNYYRQPVFANHPVVWVEWSQAEEYCTWVGGRLPTEAEWEKAARGPYDTRFFPWGDQNPNCTLANSGQSCARSPTAVGSYPAGASPYGVLDMYGNVNELVYDWYSIDYYSVSPEKNPPGPENGDYKVVRGGGDWVRNGDDNLDHLYPITFRAIADLSMKSYQIGFRCAYSAAQQIPATIVVLPTVTPPAPPMPSSRILIDAGEFQMGCPAENDCYQHTNPLHRVYLDAFLIDATEVTTAQYAQCVRANACTAPPTVSSTNHRPHYYGYPDYSDYPVVWVSWFQAEGYCRWVGGRLPAEAEWEKAARGSNDTRSYPWVDPFSNCSLLNFGAYYGGDFCIGDTNRVGSYPSGVSPYGVMDMAGNVAEWVNDWWSEDYYGVSPYENPAGPADGTEKVLRGGAWNGNAIEVRVNYRSYADPSAINDTTGFRCVYSP